MTETFDDLRNGVVLSELGGHGDGAYCATHGKGAALVMLGTYIVDPGDDVPYSERFVFKPGRENYASYLQENVAAARASGAKVGVSVISVARADSVDFLEAAEEAGADYASLCVHSVMDMFVSKGLGNALCWPEHQERLKEWGAAVVSAVSIPVIFKLRFQSFPQTALALETMTASGVPIVHLNIGKFDPDSGPLAALPDLAGLCGFLIAGGGVADVDTARQLLDAGAGAVSVGAAAMKDPDLCDRLQRALRSE